MSDPILTLTTDFGLSDHYVGVMKAVILGICPRARIVDISHEVTPYEIPEGAYLIAQAYRFFPKRTVHVVVIDPGVGTSRRPILVEAAGQYFIAPDNGVLSMIFSREKHKARVITNERYFHKPVSRTFHGRDIFAPTAAHIAAGARPASVGKLIADHLRSSFEQPLQTGKRTWNGLILRIDRFGNLVTNFRASEFPGIETRDFRLTVGPHEITVFARNYAETGPGELFALEGSSGYIEVSMSQGSAAKQIGCVTGAGVELTLW